MGGKGVIQGANTLIGKQTGWAKLDFHVRNVVDQRECGCGPVAPPTKGVEEIK
jgi:hypothetical protein